MKLLMILLLVLVGVWLWRSKRHAAPQRKPPPQEASMTPVAMVRCALCSMHLPVNEAVKGKKGLYCSAEHLQRAES